MENYEIILPESVSFILARLKERGYRADIVGGPVRDFLLGKHPVDYDITTNARPDEVKAVFPDVRIIETGIKHGTLTLLIDGVGYEVTTYRIDGEYKDQRHPESVEFTANIKDDLSRRDFTMNAIAYNPEDKITDFFDGQGDIKAKLIRAVGDPDKRFSEDALRILRAIRFASTLGFEIENHTRHAIFSKKHLLGCISAERIYGEWKKLLSGDSALYVFNEYREVVAEFLPEIKDSSMPDAKAFICSDYMVRMLSLFRLSSKSGEEFYLAMKRLKTDSATAEDGRLVLNSIDKHDLKTFSDVGRLLYEVEEKRALLIARLGILLGKYAPNVVDLMDKYIQSGRPYKLSHIAVDGEDLKRLGFFGEEIGKTLKVLLFKVINGECRNVKTELLNTLKVT